MPLAIALRDIHQPAAPSWWPPAPGWWVVLALLLFAGAAWLLWTRHRRARRRHIAALFDDAVAGAATPAEEVARISELLRRAARRRDPRADRLQGDDWLAFLDAGRDVREFDGDPGRVLLDGGFRRDVDAAQVRALHEAACRRFLEWMGA